MWSGAITVAHALARVQNIAVAAVTGSWREEYRAACSRLGLEEDLGARRLKMCKNCVQETATNSRHQDQFTWQNNPHQTRSKGKSGWSRPARPSPVTVSPLQGRVLFPRQLYIGSSTLIQACGNFTRSFVDFLTQLPWGAC